jgi:hypothetical protein
MVVKDKNLIQLVTYSIPEIKQHCGDDAEVYLEFMNDPLNQMPLSLHTEADQGVVVKSKGEVVIVANGTQGVKTSKLGFEMEGNMNFTVKDFVIYPILGNLTVANVKILRDQIDLGKHDF